MTAGAVLALPTGASADPPAVVGWWNRIQPDSAVLPITLPPPPTVPADGVYVATDILGPSAIAGVMFFVEKAVDATFTIEFAPGVTGIPAIDACPATSPITQTSNGSWSSRPTADCDNGKVAGVLSSDSLSMTFALPASFATTGTAYEIVLVPSGTTPFSAPVNAPADGSLTGPTPADTGTTAPPPVETPAPGFEPAASPSFAPSPSFSPSPSGGGDFNLPPAAPDVSTGTGGETALPPSPRATARPAAFNPVDERGDRVIAVVLLALMGAGLWWLAGRPVPHPKLLGGVSSAGGPRALQPALVNATVGGIGRFARPRTAAPNRL